MKINITKAHGTQNYFLIIENKENDPRLHQQEYIKKICKYKSDERIDGVLILSDNHLDYKMDYYNNDGTWETICANGARCAGLYMFNHYHKKIMEFATGDGIHRIEILDNNLIKLDMIKPKYCSDEIPVHKVKGFHVDSGATHFVVKYPKIKDDTVRQLGAKIRYDKKFSPRGINVNFYEIINKNEINVKTYEKGIEDLMMSCGSGSVASAFHLSMQNMIESPLTVNVPGGKFMIEFDRQWDNVSIIGPAKIEYTYEMEI